MGDAVERRALVLILAGAFLSALGIGVIGGNSDWELIVRMLALLAFLTAIVLSLGILVADDIAQRLPPRRTLLLAACAALAVGVLLTAINVVSSTLDLLDENDVLQGLRG